MQNLKERLKTRDFPQVMLFCGEEKYLMDVYLKRTVEALLMDGDQAMNYDLFTDKKLDIQTVMDSAETMPFFADKRVVVLKNCDVFAKARAGFSKELAEFLPKISETTHMIIVEQEVDKRIKLYKELQKLGMIAQFPYLSESELVQFVARGLSKYQLKISQNDGHFMIHQVGGELTLLENEIEKLANYAFGQEIVSRKDIEAVCQKSVESRIFDLVDCMGTNKREMAMKLYHDLLVNKEPAARILFMLTRQFRLNYYAKVYDMDRYGQSEIAKLLKVQPFIIRKCLEQGRGFTVKRLEEALGDALATEINIRTGVYTPEFAVEQLIIRYSG